MRTLRFVLLSAAILLAGAAGVGFAARAVVEPQAGQVQSAGEIPVPSVLGRTAEEVRFYPWPLYGSEQLRPLTDEEIQLLTEPQTSFAVGEAGEITEIPAGDADMPLLILMRSCCPAGCSLELDAEEMCRSLESNADSSGRFPSHGEDLFLSDFPAAAVFDSGERVPVTVSMAVSEGTRNCFSTVIETADKGEIAEDERNRALQQVQNDLETVMTGEDRSDSTCELADYLRRIYLAGSSIFTDAEDFEQMFYVVSQYLVADRSGTGSALEQEDGKNPAAGGKDSGSRVTEAVTDMVRIDEDTDVQLITAQDQIVLLFSRGRSVFGVYYDIRMGCYAGYGEMN